MNLTMSGLHRWSLGVALGGNRKGLGRGFVNVDGGLQASAGVLSPTPANPSPQLRTEVSHH